MIEIHEIFPTDVTPITILTGIAEWTLLTGETRVLDLYSEIGLEGIADILNDYGITDSPEDHFPKDELLDALGEMSQS